MSEVKGVWLKHPDGSDEFVPFGSTRDGMPRPILEKIAMAIADSIAIGTRYKYEIPEEVAVSAARAAVEVMREPPIDAPAAWEWRPTMDEAWRVYIDAILTPHE